MNSIGLMAVGASLIALVGVIASWMVGMYRMSRARKPFKAMAFFLCFTAAELLAWVIGFRWGGWPTH